LIGLAGLLGRIETNGNGRRDFKRTRHAHPVEHGARGFEHLGGAFEQFIRNIVVEARFDNEKARALEVARLGANRSSWFGHTVSAVVSSKRLWASGSHQKTGLPNMALSSKLIGREQARCAFRDGA